MDGRRLIQALRENSMARLRHAVLKEAGVLPFSLKAALLSNRRILRYACHMVLDREVEAAQGSPGFDMKRFAELKEGRCGRV